jgi:hypothetical protein
LVNFFRLHFLLIGRPCVDSKFVMISCSCLVLFLLFTFCGLHRRHLCWTLLIMLVEFALLERWVWLICLWKQASNFFQFGFSWKELFVVVLLISKLVETKDGSS